MTACKCFRTINVRWFARTEPPPSTGDSSTVRIAFPHDNAQAEQGGVAVALALDARKAGQPNSHSYTMEAGCFYPPPNVFRCKMVNVGSLEKHPDNISTIGARSTQTSVCIKRRFDDEPETSMVGDHMWPILLPFFSGRRFYFWWERLPERPDAYVPMKKGFGPKKKNRPPQGRNAMDTPSAWQSGRATGWSFVIPRVASSVRRIHRPASLM